MTSETQTAPEASTTPSAAASESSSALVGQANSNTLPSDSFHTSLAGLAAKLSLQLDLRVPLPSFRVQNLLALEKGQVIESAWPHTEDLPLWSGGVHLVWTEFEVVDQKLAVRITRLV